MEFVKRRRGRPPGSSTLPPDLRGQVWIAIWLYRVSERIRIGRTPSVRQACHEVAAGRGIICVIGGDQNSLEEANAQRRKAGKKAWYPLQTKSRDAKLNPEAATFASHMITDPETLEARYSEANQLVKADRRVRVTWMNIGRQMLGRPAKKVPVLGQVEAPGVTIRVSRNFVAN